MEKDVKPSGSLNKMHWKKRFLEEQPIPDDSDSTPPTLFISSSTATLPSPPSSTQTSSSLPSPLSNSSTSCLPSPPSSISLSISLPASPAPASSASSVLISDTKSSPSSTAKTPRCSRPPSPIQVSVSPEGPLDNLPPPAKRSRLSDPKSQFEQDQGAGLISSTKSPQDLECWRVKFYHQVNPFYLPYADQLPNGYNGYTQPFRVRELEGISVRCTPDTPPISPDQLKYKYDNLVQSKQFSQSQQKLSSIWPRQQASTGSFTPIAHEHAFPYPLPSEKSLLVKQENCDISKENKIVESDHFRGEFINSETLSKSLIDSVLHKHETNTHAEPKGFQVYSDRHEVGQGKDQEEGWSDHGSRGFVKTRGFNDVRGYCESREDDESKEDDESREDEESRGDEDRHSLTGSIADPTELRTGEDEVTNAQRKPRRKKKETKDEAEAREYGIDKVISVRDIIHLSMDDLNDRLSSSNLTAEQQDRARVIRRKGKNKVAAQSCRKRKNEKVDGLAVNLNNIRIKNEQLEKEISGSEHRRQRLVEEITAMETEALRRINCDPQFWQIEMDYEKEEIRVRPRQRPSTDQDNLIYANGNGSRQEAMYMRDETRHSPAPMDNGKKIIPIRPRPLVAEITRSHIHEAILPVGPRNLTPELIEVSRGQDEKLYREGKLFDAERSDVGIGISSRTLVPRYIPYPGEQRYIVVPPLHHTPTNTIPIPSTRDSRLSPIPPNVSCIPRYSSSPVPASRHSKGFSEQPSFSSPPVSLLSPSFPSSSKISYPPSATLHPHSSNKRSELHNSDFTMRQQLNRTAAARHQLHGAPVGPTLVAARDLHEVPVNEQLTLRTVNQTLPGAAVDHQPSGIPVTQQLPREAVRQPLTRETVSQQLSAARDLQREPVNLSIRTEIPQRKFQNSNRDSTSRQAFLASKSSESHSLVVKRIGAYKSHSESLDKPINYIHRKRDTLNQPRDYVHDSLTKSSLYNESQTGELRNPLDVQETRGRPGFSLFKVN